MKTRRKVYKTVPFQNENICRHRRMKCAIKPNIEIKKRKRAHIAGPSRNGNVNNLSTVWLRVRWWLSSANRN